MNSPPPLAIRAQDAPTRSQPSNYPSPFATLMSRRTKRPLGDLFGLTSFGVNLTSLAPGAASALLHRHSRQDEFVYVIEGTLLLITDNGEEVLEVGDCAGFPAMGLAHQLVNRSDKDAVFLEVGDRVEDDEVIYPADDLVGLRTAGSWTFTHKDGAPYLPKEDQEGATTSTSSSLPASCSTTRARRS